MERGTAEVRVHLLKQTVSFCFLFSVSTKIAITAEEAENFLVKFVDFFCLSFQSVPVPDLNSLPVPLTETEAKQIKITTQK